MDQNDLKKNIYDRMQDPEMLEFRKMLQDKFKGEDPETSQKRIDAMSKFHMTPTEIDETAANTNPDMPLPVGGLIGSIAKRGGGMVPAAMNIPTQEFGNIARQGMQRAAPKIMAEVEQYLPAAQKALAGAKTPEEKLMFQGIMDKLINASKGR